MKTLPSFLQKERRLRWGGWGSRGGRGTSGAVDTGSGSGVGGARAGRVRAAGAGAGVPCVKASNQAKLMPCRACVNCDHTPDK